MSHLYLGNVWPHHVNVVEDVLAVGSFGTSRTHVARPCRVVIFFFYLQSDACPTSSSCTRVGLLR